MSDQLTMIRAPSPDGGRALSSVLPADLLDQVRGRVRLLAGLLLVAFAFDPLFFFGNWAWAAMHGQPLAADVSNSGPFQWVNLAAVVTSATLWWAAGSGRVSASRLHTIGLVYEIAICLVLSIVAIWQHYLEKGSVPNLTWVPTIVVLFPLIMPGPPLRMLAAAIAAGATTPLAILVLSRLGIVTANVDDYARTIVGACFAVGFAYLGARIVYGLGREVAAAREMGSYQLEARLGAGGMGEVWRARHRLLARPAAIKLIRTPAGGAKHGASMEARRRFEREAQAIAQLRSPHTVHLFDFGVAADGAFYYVMELLDGLDAEKLVQKAGPIPAERAIHVLKQVCHSLSEAESLGLVHRDIKPANIFLCRYGEDDDFVKVLDFGLVKAVQSGRGDDETAVTRDHVIAGTPAYMAPEQAVGRDDLDGRADIYATGCVAYWLLTGQRVFDGDTPMAILMQHATTMPAAPSTRTELPIPPALDDLVMACLAKDPSDRPQSARELSRRLAAVPCHDAWTDERAHDWWRGVGR